MFTGIVTDVGRVVARDDREGRRLTLAAAYDTASIPLGASISHNGVCLTVVETSQDGWLVQASGETLSVTTVGDWDVGDLVNLERSLKIGDELGGHIVFGHVDAIGTIAAIEELGESRRVEIAIPEQVQALVAVKGSIAVDGVSLTVNELTSAGFVVNLIPHSWRHTNFRERKVGDRVNVEADMLARYVARQLHLMRHD